MLNRAHGCATEFWIYPSNLGASRLTKGIQCRSRARRCHLRNIYTGLIRYELFYEIVKRAAVKPSLERCITANYNSPGGQLMLITGERYRCDLLYKTYSSRRRLFISSVSRGWCSRGNRYSIQDHHRGGKLIETALNYPRDGLMARRLRGNFLV